MEPKRTILIVDDHPLVREGIKNTITTNRDYQIVGEAASGSEALQMVSQLNPDLVLMDISLPDLSGLEVTRQIRTLRKKTKVMIVSMHAKIDYIVRAFQAGATGFITKESPPQKLLLAARTVLNGDFYMDTRVSHKVVEKLMNVSDSASKPKNADYENLTPREQEILTLLAEGLTSQQIADRLFISLKTVKNHRANIMQKLDLHSNYDLLRYAARIGLIDLDLWQD